MEEIINKPLIKRKRNRYWEIYISKVLKKISSKSGITSNAKQQLNSVLCQLSEIISTIVFNLTIYAKKKTIDTKEVLNAFRVMLPGELGKNVIEEGLKAVNSFKLNRSERNTNKYRNRQDKAGIIFPPSIAEKFLRNFGYYQIMVSSTAPVCFATAVQYIATNILLLAKNVTGLNRVRITIRDLELAVRNDKELNHLFVKRNIVFLGGGVVPYIHPSLLSKKLRKKVIKNVKNKTDNTLDKVSFVKKHRYRPGTVAIREIRKFQNLSNCLAFARLPFEKLVRSIITEQNPNTKMKVSKEVFTVLQYFIEQKMVELLRLTNDLAIHAGRVKITPEDIRLADYISNQGSSVKHSK